MTAPTLMSRDEIRAELSTWDPACWPEAALSPFWLNEPVPQVGGKVLVCERVGPASCGWVWVSVCAVYRWRVLVQMPCAGPPGSKLVRGDKFSVDRECIHIALSGEADDAAYAAWHRVRQQSSNKPAAVAASGEIR
jgi:hypothetical protein